MSPRLISSTTFLALGGVGFVLVLGLLVASGASRMFDHAIIDVIRSPRLSVLLSPLGPITELGSTGAVTVVAILTVAVGVAIGPWVHGLIGAAVIALASLGNGLLKAFVARERPDLLEPIIVERGFSFPSGHAALGMVAWGIFAVLVSRSRLPHRLRMIAIVGLAVVVFLVGLSRVWLGVHYPTDVIAGWTAGSVIVLIYARLTRGVSREPAEGAVDVDPAGPRSDRPAPG
jgi:undecaprenyl-diphosphatase